MGGTAGSNTDQPETIALSITILELLLETGVQLWIVVQNRPEYTEGVLPSQEIPPQHSTLDPVQ